MIFRCDDALDVDAEYVMSPSGGAELELEGTVNAHTRSPCQIGTVSLHD